MILKPNKDGTFTISFLLIPEYSMVALLFAIEPMRIANRLSGRDIFHWQLLSAEEHPVAASNDLILQQQISIDESDTPHNLFVCCSFNPQKNLHQEAISWLKNLSRKGSLIGAMDTGCYLLAAADLINDQQITLHWEAIPAFSEDHPNITVTHELFEIDRKLITCAGGTSAMDLIFHIIQMDIDNDLAIAVCEQLIKNGIREHSDNQRINLAHRLNIHHPRLIKVIALMEDNLDTPLSTANLAEQAHISVRQLERLFQTHLDNSPSGYYLQLRLEKAQHLLRESHLSINEISIACGFSSGSHFARSYRKRFNISPNEER